MVRNCSCCDEVSDVSSISPWFNALTHALVMVDLLVHLKFTFKWNLAQRLDIWLQHLMISVHQKGFLPLWFIQVWELFSFGLLVTGFSTKLPLQYRESWNGWNHFVFKWLFQLQMAQVSTLRVVRLFWLCKGSGKRVIIVNFRLSDFFFHPEQFSCLFVTIFRWQNFFQHSTHAWKGGTWYLQFLSLSDR